MPRGPAPTPCIMRYGVAAGPAMAGILPGLVPMFDVFGAAVVAASRLERSCPPGRIHVCPPSPCRAMPFLGHRPIPPPPRVG